MGREAAARGDERLVNHVERFLERLKDVRKRGNGWTACCPAHDDQHPSLDVDIGEDGRLLLMCRSGGCDAADICAAAGVDLRELFPDGGCVPNPSANGHAKKVYPTLSAIAEAAARRKGGRVEGTYIYRDAGSNPVFAVVRVRLANGEKEILQVRPEADGWVFGGIKSPRPLYRLHELLAADPVTPVSLFEGEQKADLAVSLGLLGTSCSQGAGNGRFTDFTPLASHILHLYADNDAKGNEHIQDVAQRAYAASVTQVWRVTLPGLPPKGDIVDFYEQRRQSGVSDDAILDEIHEAVARAELINPPANPKVEEPSPAPIPAQAKEAPAELDLWPAPLGQAARVGFLGEFLAAVEDQTEADPAAIAADLVVRVGNAVHSGPHFTVSGDRHGCNEFFAIVGPTAFGRKGSSAAFPRRVMEIADPTWSTTCIKSGLSSGEGLIEAIRDPKRIGTDKKTGEPVFDEGVADKRAFIFESELARTLRAGARRDSTLFPVLRQAWEGGRLASLTRQPYSASSSHISLLSHVSRDEFRSLLNDLDIAGGTVNRFLFIASKRQRALPYGGRVPTPVLEAFGKRLGANIDKARRFASEMLFTGPAHEQWPDVYYKLAEDEQGAGLMGQLLGRAVAHTRRLAMVLAIIDGCTAVDVRHVDAAVEFWHYSKATIRYLFGTATGNRIADRILAELLGTPDGVARTEIHRLFNKHVTAQDINTALQLLHRLGLARPEKVQTGGKPREVWHATPRA